MNFNRNRKLRHRTIDRYQHKKTCKAFGGWSEKLSKKKRKAIKRKQLRNKKLCKKYPWLIPRNRWTGVRDLGDWSYTELGAMLSGWRKAFGDLWCEDIDREWRRNWRLGGSSDDFMIMQLKEKYGEFRQYFSSYPNNMMHVINGYEFISGYICRRCGKLDSPIIEVAGWYEPLCMECYIKGTAFLSSKRTKEDYVNLLKEAGIEKVEDMMIPMNYKVHCWSPGQNDYEEVTVDISELTTKIRYKNRKRRSNIEDVKDVFE